ncbi:MAG: rubredoxin [Lachnospiraceae bacterium]|jgi:rubredoxin/flavin reductase (DIM6/NTAB) family NADH-FMN oxidoreductase RutF|nr:rubredoxin [Lachnospiraceae bacterium]
MDSKAMFKLTYGLFVLTAANGDRHNGCIINTAGQVTAEPNRISIAVNKSDYTHGMVLEDGRFNISVIAEDATFDLFKRFGFQSGRDTDKFAGFNDFATSANGLTYITKGTNAFISARTSQTVDLGTHTLFIADVTDLDILSGVASTTYTYYQSNIKPKPQGAAPKNGDVIWRCRICGWEYNETKGDPSHGIAPGTHFEDIPADFVCPICKHPKADFEKVV